MAEKDKVLKEATIEAHLKEIACLTGLHSESERLKAISQAETDQMKHYIQQLETQISQQKDEANARSLEIQQVNEHWQSIEKKMETMAADMLDAKLTIKATSATVGEVLPAGQVPIDPKVVDDLNSRVNELSGEVENLQNRNSYLEAAATTLVDRHKQGELVSPWYSANLPKSAQYLVFNPPVIHTDILQTPEENELVKHVVQSTIQVNQKDLVQKSNDLKRVSLLILRAFS